MYDYVRLKNQTLTFEYSAGSVNAEFHIVRVVRMSCRSGIPTAIFSQLAATRKVKFTK